MGNHKKSRQQVPSAGFFIYSFKGQRIIG